MEKQEIIDRVVKLLEKRRLRTAYQKIEVVGHFTCPHCHASCWGILIFLGGRKHRHAFYDETNDVLGRLT